MEIFDYTNVNFAVEDYMVITREYSSKDGTKVPITIVFKKDILRNGKNPTLLESYGGFGSIHEPHFDPALVYFLSKGGVYAYAHVRGEGTLGREWSLQGKRLNKQKTFDDFIAAAEYLIKENYTSPSKLAITGGSNGGLLIGAAMVQRPELFKLAIPVVGVYDMLRFEKFTVGVFHIREYGTVNNKNDFKNLLSYSPLHNIKPGINYPTTLIMTSDNDVRVPPFHSYKFAAKLQNNPGQKNQILLRVEKNAGHNGATSIFGEQEEQADMYGFILNTLEKESK